MSCSVVVEMYLPSRSKLQERIRAPWYGVGRFVGRRGRKPMTHLKLVAEQSKLRPVQPQLNVEDKC